MVSLGIVTLGRRRVINNVMDSSVQRERPLVSPLNKAVQAWGMLPGKDWPVDFIARSPAPGGFISVS